MLPQTHLAHTATAGRSKKWVGDEGDSYEERGREGGREGGREEGGRRRWKDLNAGYRSIQELLVYPMLSTAHFALYIDMNMSG